ncbi:hypothetical protein AVEN_273702-1 [Araneus ventricosus]|uniref:Uncharacterized protein n=1 Tax=Araneus ventricosus TaxID=182803 RepID=A0A4Y2R9H8_ARAVE|nr:hypothetical protein AVEN_273702-1 [Araneus ventricosus]
MATPLKKNIQIAPDYLRNLDKRDASTTIISDDISIPVVQEQPFRHAIHLSLYRYHLPSSPAPFSSNRHRVAGVKHRKRGPSDIGEPHTKRTLLREEFVFDRSTKRNKISGNCAK